MPSPEAQERPPHPPTESFSPEVPLGDAARDLVFRALTRQVRRFPELDIAGLDETRVGPTGAEPARLDPRDAALAHAIHDAVVRRWLTLEHILGTVVSRLLSELEPAMRAVLLGGAAQLLLLDRIPAHAAINSAVEWAKRRINPGAGGMANAVLRKVAALRAEGEGSSGGGGGRRDRPTDRRDEIPLSDGTALALARDVLPTDDLHRLSVATSHPIDLLRAWSASMPFRDVRQTAMHSLAAPPVILNTAHMQPWRGDPRMDLAALAADSVVAPHEAPGHHVYYGPHAQLAALLQARHDLWVQDPASSLAVESAAGLEKVRLVLDLCAGQGTKTRQLAATFPDAEIVATDIDDSRRRTLAAVFKGHPRVTVAEPGSIRDHCGEGADLILLDVPCSNTGVLGRRPEARYRFGERSMGSLTQTQRQIIADSIPLLRPAGGTRLLYSTCSLEPQENQQMAAWASRWHSLRSVRERRRLPAGGPGEPSTRYTDGSFAVVLE